MPFVLVVGLGLAPGPAARTLERLRESPLSALILLNVLNVADAVLTWAAIDSKQASEANPVVRMLGLPAKVMLVAAISLILLPAPAAGARVDRAGVPRRDRVARGGAVLHRPHVASFEMCQWWGRISSSASGGPHDPFS